MTTAILTRPSGRIGQTAQVYRAAGLQVLQAPVFSIRANPMLRSEWLKLPADTWVILSVHALHHALQIAPDWSPGEHTRVIAVGPAVANAWRRHFSHPIEQHAMMNSEGVIELLKQRPCQAVKILTNRDGRGLIRQHCMSAGISYQQINVYERHQCPLPLAEVRALYEHGQPVLTATSGDILRGFAAQLDVSTLRQAQQQPLVVGAARIARLAGQLGFAQVVLAGSPADEAMCAAVQSLAMED